MGSELFCGALCLVKTKSHQYYILSDKRALGKRKGIFFKRHRSFAVLFGQLYLFFEKQERESRSRKEEVDALHSRSSLKEIVQKYFETKSFAFIKKSALSFFLCAVLPMTRGHRVCKVA